MNYRELLMQNSTPIIRDEGFVHSVDSLGRIVLPKALRTKYGIIPGNTVSFYTIEYLGDSYFAFKIENGYGDRTKYVRAVEVLRELGCEIPELLAMQAGVQEK